MLFRSPIRRPGNRRHTTRTINRSVDLITLRDDLSRGELTRMGIVEPEIKLAADPTIILHPASEAQMDQVMEDLGIPVDGKYLGFGLRSWNGLEAVADEIVKAAEYAYETYGLIPVFVPIEFPSDLTPARMIADRLHCPHYMVERRLPIE